MHDLEADCVAPAARSYATTRLRVCLEDIAAAQLARYTQPPPTGGLRPTNPYRHAQLGLSETRILTSTTKPPRKV